MRKRIAMTLALSLLLAPALPLLADPSTGSGQAPSTGSGQVPSTGSGQDAVAVPAATSPTAQAAPGPVDGAPALPDAAAQDVSATPSADVKAAPVEVPKDVLVQPGQAKADVQPSRFQTGNFILGFLGGALLGGAAGVLLLSTDSNGVLDQDKLKVMLPLGLVGGGLIGGTVSLLLGATSPQEAQPPKVEGRRPAPAPRVVATLHF